MTTPRHHHAPLVHHSLSCATRCATAVLAVTAIALSCVPAFAQATPQPVPNRIVVLTFDDTAKSHYTTVRPILKRYGFGATFFVTEGFDVATNHQAYMTWDEIAQLHRDGFEIGNHTLDHMPVTKDSLPKLKRQIEAIHARCLEHGIPRPVSFAYPGNAFDLAALGILESCGIRFARRGSEPERPYRVGRGIAFEIGLDHPLLIPTAGDARPDWTDRDFIRAVQLGQGGRIAVLQFHGVPDREHPWVSTDPERFRRWMRYLAEHDYTVIALRDLARYIPDGSQPVDPTMIMRDRKNRISREKPLHESRPPRTPAERDRWLRRMKRHQYSLAEMVAATGLPESQLASALARLKPAPTETPPSRRGLEVVPYPGGRHPRRGFRDGAVRPQRETKISVFMPWNPRQYVVLDLPEAIWMRREEKRELLFLAHTHVPTIWDKRGIEVDRSEWKAVGDHGWTVHRLLPNGVRFGTRVQVVGPTVRMQLWLENGSRQRLTGLRIQNCAMLAATGLFAEQTNANKIFRAPYAAVHDETGRRWIIFAWENCQRAWGNEKVPCLHSDPQFPDCPPGERRELAGWLSFYEGADIDAELHRIDQLKWWENFNVAN